jgi:Uncharacterized protein conserved in bacteria (DUF2330)
MRRVRRTAAAAVLALTALFALAAPILACGGLIGPNGAVNLLRTTTFAGYHDGVEHYVTAFEFAGGGGAFGSLIPLPDVPTDVVKGGDWTLQRLIRETEPLFLLRAAESQAASDTAGGAEVILTTRIDALDITVLKGGGAEVGKWATDHGFRLPPDAPEVLDFYAARSPIFLAAAFDADAAAARGQAVGDGTPVHITIPTDDPWVPLRILGLGKTGQERIQADVYLLTDHQPALMPVTSRPGVLRTHDQPASSPLLTDLRSDRGMGWIPHDAWLTKIQVDAAAADLRYDLAVDVSGANAPSLVDAGFIGPSNPSGPIPSDARLLLLSWVVVAAAMAIFGALGVGERRSRGRISFSG